MWPARKRSRSGMHPRSRFDYGKIFFRKARLPSRQATGGRKTRRTFNELYHGKVFGSPVTRSHTNSPRCLPPVVRYASAGPIAVETPVVRESCGFGGVYGIYYRFKAIAILCMSIYSIDILTNEPDERWKCRAYVVSVKNERSTYERPSVWNVALYPPTVPTQVSSPSLNLAYFTVNQSYENFIHARPLPSDAWKWPIRFTLQQLIVCMMSSVKAVFRQDKTNCRGFRVSP